MKNDYEVGSFITDFKTIYEITLISQDKDGESLIHYKPVSGTDKIFLATIPEKNLQKSGLRPLLKTGEINQLMKDLEVVNEDYKYNTIAVKEEIYRNLPSKLIDPLRYLWKSEIALNKIDNDLKEEILSSMAAEIAFVLKKTTRASRQMIETALGEAGIETKNQ